MTTEHWFNERGVIYDENRLTVAFVYGQEDDDSDARRMAASNQMLDALKQVADQLSSATVDAATRQLVQEAIRAAEAEDSPELTTLRREEVLWHGLGDRYADPARTERWIVLDGQGRAFTPVTQITGDTSWEWGRPRVQQIERTVVTREVAEGLKQQRESALGQFRPYIVRDIHDYARERAFETREHIERLPRESWRPSLAPDTPSNLAGLHDLPWSQATGTLAAAPRDRMTGTRSPTTATERQLRLPLSLSAHSEILDALQDSALAVPGLRPVAYSQGPWVVERDLLGELQPFNADGTHLLSGEGDNPLPLEEREANGRLMGAAPQLDARLGAMTAFLRRLVSAHPDEVADYISIAADHFEKNIAILAAVEGAPQPPIEADADTDQTIQTTLSQPPAEPPAQAQVTSPQKTAAGVIITRIAEVRNILREHGWDGTLMGELRKEVGAMTLGFDHKVETVGPDRDQVSVAYVASDVSEGEHNKGAPPLVQLTDPMTSEAADLVLRFEGELAAALEALGIEGDLHQGTTPDELGPR